MNEWVNKQQLPLQGIRVLELSHIVAGPSAGMMLGDMGADVIKIEHPETGDTARSHDNAGGTFYTFNRNKQFLALDLRHAKGKAIFEKLVARADVVLDKDPCIELNPTVAYNAEAHAGTVKAVKAILASTFRLK